MLEGMGFYRKDVQWISGLLFVFFLTIALLTGGVVRMMAPEIAKPALANLFKNTLPETNSIKNYAQTRKSLGALPAKAYFRVQGIPEVGLTAGEAAKLDAKGFISKVSDDIAFRIYEGGTSAFVPQDQQDIAPLANISRANYKKLSDIGDGFWALAIIFGLIMFIFGRRYGRVFSLGFAILVATALPLTLFQFAVSAVSNPSTSPNAKLYFALIAGLKPAIIESQQYVIKFISLSGLLMVAAVVGRIAHSLTAPLRESREAENDAVKKSDLHQTRLLEIQMPYDKAFDLCLESLKLVDATVKEEDRALGKLTAKTWRQLGKFFKPSSRLGERLCGIGETIGFVLFRIDDESTRIQVSSDPSGWVMFDPWNNNFKNVEKITNFFEEKRTSL